MRLYRIAHVDLAWETTKPSPTDNGHPLYVHRPGQGSGRFDYPEHYLALYLARQPAAAIGEVLQHMASWPQSEIARRRTIGTEAYHRCLVSLDVDGTVLDLDDPAPLDRLGWRPSDVVNKDRAKTRQLPLKQWFHRDATDIAGLQWWSSCLPAWTVAMCWDDPITPTWHNVTIVEVEPVDHHHPAVKTASAALNRPIVA